MYCRDCCPSSLVHPGSTPRTSVPFCKCFFQPGQWLILQFAWALWVQRSSLALHRFGSKRRLWSPKGWACSPWAVSSQTQDPSWALSRGGGGRSANSPIPVDSIAHPDQFSCSLFRKPRRLGLSDRGFSCEDAHTCWRFLVRRGSQQRTKAGEGRIPDQCPSCHTQSPGPALPALARQPFQRFHCPEVEGVGRCTFPGLPLLL